MKKIYLALASVFLFVSLLSLVSASYGIGDNSKGGVTVTNPTTIIYNGTNTINNITTNVRYT